MKHERTSNIIEHRLASARQAIKDWRKELRRKPKLENEDLYKEGVRVFIRNLQDEIAEYKKTLRFLNSENE